MSRLIIISNRVSAPTADNTGSQGGLSVALAAALREAEGIWFGWSGMAGESTEPKFETHDGVTSATIDLPEQDIEEYYDGYANRTLWPLFHYRLGLSEFERDFQGGYERVNRLFGHVVSPHIQPDDLIWVHDYHMIPLGWALRQQGLANRIGFFLHIPWPPTRLLTVLPDHRRLVEVLFAYDVIGFQTQEWLATFHDYVITQMDGTIHEDGSITVGARTIKAIACPIGIDSPDFAATMKSPEAIQTHKRMIESSIGRDLIVGVDRLDYSKGIEERFHGYQRYLETRPEAHASIYLLQIAPPSRESVQSYRDIRDGLDALSGRINGKFSDIDWVPLRYVNKGYPRAILAGVYRAARIGLVTPLRDGMNLVAKEYIAAQDPEDPGVLILSSFAGAAAQLDQALLINPYSADDIADAIEKALSMPREERIARWKPMFDNISKEDVHWWREQFISQLAGHDSVDAGLQEQE